MTAKTLKIALAVSVALNLFAVAGGVTYFVASERIERKIEDQRQPGRDRPLQEVLADLDPAVRERVRTALRESATAARPDFEAARAARRQAIDIAGQPVLDTARVETLLEQSRAAEMRGRTRLENGAVAVLATLTLEERKVLAPILQRKSDVRRAIVNNDERNGRQRDDRPSR